MKPYNRPLLLFIFLLAVLFILNWLTNTGQSIAPKISFIDIDQNTHNLSDYKDKPILVVFWATDCPGCIQEMPELIKLYATYDPKSLTILGIAMAHDSLDHIKAMRKKRQLPYTITWDHDGRIAQAFDNVRVTPTHFLIDPSGDIVMRKIGVLNIELLHNKLQDMGISPIYL